MSVRFPCPSCRREMLLDPVHEGFEVPCPHCGRSFAVPSGTAAEPPVPPPRRPPTAAESPLPLVFGIFGIVGVFGAVCTNGCLLPLGLFAPAAWYVGHVARRDARADGRAPPDTATAGWVLGIVGTALLVVGVCVVALMIGVFVRVGGR